MNEQKPTNAARRRTHSRFSALFRNRKVIRWLLAGLIGCITLILIGIHGYPLLTIHVAGLTNLDYSELVAKLIEIKRERSSKLFDVALVLSGALFALLIAKKSEARVVFADYPEVIMLSAASALLVTSLACNIIYLGLVSDSLYLGASLEGQMPAMDHNSMPNIFESAFERFYTAQIIFLCGGAFAAASTLFSAHRLKEVTHNA
jgi:hypothetical protein